VTLSLSNIKSFLGEVKSKMYFNYERGCFHEIYDGSDDISSNVHVKKETEECMAYGFKAVAGPRSFEAALKHPMWGEASRLERDTLRDGPLGRKYHFKGELQ
jgi:hypothetical protein